MSFLIAIDNALTSVRPVYAGSYFAELSENERLSKRFTLGPGVTITVDHSPISGPLVGWGARKYAELQIARELEQYCYMCPVPLYLDGRRLDGHLRAGPFHPRNTYRPIWSGGSSVEEGTLPLALPDSFFDRKNSVFEDVRATLRRQPTATKSYQSAFVFGLHFNDKGGASGHNLSQRSQLHWLKKGVVLASIPFYAQTFYLSCQVFINADDLDLDLSGFGLRESPAKSSRQSEAQKSTGFALAKAKIQEFCFIPVTEEPLPADLKEDAQLAASHRIKRLLKVGGGGILLSLTSPVFAIGTLAGVAYTCLEAPPSRIFQLPKYPNYYLDAIERDREFLARVLSEK